MIESKRTFIRLLTCGLDPLEMLNLSATDGTPTTIVGFRQYLLKNSIEPGIYLVSITNIILYDAPYGTLIDRTELL